MIPALPMVAGAFVGGALLGGLAGGPAAASMACTVVVLAVLALLTRSRISWLVLVAAAAFAGAGHARALDHAGHRTGFSEVQGTHELVGIARAEPGVRGSTLHVRVRLEQLDGRSVTGDIELLARAGPRFRSGDRIRFIGEVEPPTLSRRTGSDFGLDGVVAFPAELSVIGHKAPPGPAAALAALRERSVANIERVLPEPESSLAVGMLLGEQQSMPDALTDQLRATGTMHLIVVSGQNVALVLALAIAAMSAVVSRRRAAALALLLLPAYVVLVGAEPPVVRAAIMAVGLTFAEILGRRTPGWIFLAYAAALMLALDPGLANSLSFQLSFAATAGVLAVAPPLRDVVMSRLRLTSSGIIASVIEVGAVSTGAALAVAPVQAVAFGTLPLLQIPANILVAPLYEATLLAAMAAAVVANVPPLIAPARALLTPAPAAFLSVVRALAMPWAILEVPPLRGGSIVAWYASLALVAGLLARAKPVILAPGSSSGLALTVILGTTALGLWHSVARPSDGTASVTVLDVGQGLAVLVRDGGNAVLVDTGPPDGSVVAALGRENEFGTLDAVILTHEDIDHTGGLDAIERRLGVRVLLVADDSPRPDARTIDIGDRIHVSDRTTVEVLSPPVQADSAARSDNNGALVLLVSIGERRFLLPSDIEAGAEHWLVRSGLDLHADAVVVPHHGSTTSSTAEFIAAVQPRVAVVSVGRSNPYGHPNDGILARYADALLLRTDQDGDVTLRSDGQRLWLAPAHGRADFGGALASAVLP